MSIYILDGYNVIYAVPELKKKLDQSLEAARDGLLGCCAGLSGRRGDIQRIYVVFDGNEDFAHLSNCRHDRISVLFTRQKEEADDRILELIRKDTGRHSFIIVSNDNYVFNNSKAHGAKVISVSEFYALVEKPQKGNRKDKIEIPNKALSADRAKKITEEYRKHLGI